MIGYRHYQQNVDALNAVPGNTIEATTDPAKIREADVVIIAVPTPVTRAKDPDAGPVIQAYRQFRQMPADKIRSLMNDHPVLIDVRGWLILVWLKRLGWITGNCNRKVIQLPSIFFVTNHYRTELCNTLCEGIKFYQ